MDSLVEPFLAAWCDAVPQCDPTQWIKCGDYECDKQSKSLQLTNVS